MKHEELTRKIIGCAMKIHSLLGNGFQEVIYQRALAIELAYENIAFQREMEMPIFYRDEQIGTRRVDFFVEEKVMVELKAVEKLEGVHGNLLPRAQALRYREYRANRIAAKGRARPSRACTINKIPSWL